MLRSISQNLGKYLQVIAGEKLWAIYRPSCFFFLSTWWFSTQVSTYQNYPSGGISFPETSVMVQANKSLPYTTPFSLYKLLNSKLISSQMDSPDPKSASSVPLNVDIPIRIMIEKLLACHNSPEMVSINFLHVLEYSKEALQSRYQAVLSANDLVCPAKHPGCSV